MPPIITLLTDFGTRDGYVAAMKGVILGICPAARIVDLTHEVAPQAVGEAAFLLSTIAPHYPEDTIHTVVVDPGVGSDRRSLAARCGGQVYVAPDNGVLSWVVAPAAPYEAVSLTARRYWRPAVSHTFYGRDVFAPVAAHLAAGVPLDALGPAVDDLAMLDIPQARRHADGATEGAIIHVDHFGNLITNIPAAWLVGGGERTVEIGGARIGGVATTYSEAMPGELLALVGGSHGNLEVAVRDGSAAERLGLGVGARVVLWGGEG